MYDLIGLSPARIFELSGLLVLPFWALMILLPAWRWTRRILGSPWIAAPAAVLYALLVLPGIAEVLPQVASPELSAIAPLLGSPEGALIAWAHFLAFDLFVGRWAYLDGRARGETAWLVSPILFFVLMLGPLGWLAYMILRALRPTPGEAPPAASSRSDR